MVDGSGSKLVLWEGGELSWRQRGRERARERERELG